MKKGESKFYNSRKKILNSFSHIIDSYNINEISSSMLCTNCGISRSTFYRHYENISEVLKDYLKFLFDTYISSINKITGTKEKINFFLTNFKINHLIFKRIFINSASSLYNFTIRTFKEFIDYKVQENNFIVSEDFLANYIINLAKENQIKLKKAIHNVLPFSLYFFNRWMVFKKFLDSCRCAKCYCYDFTIIFYNTSITIYFMVNVITYFNFLIID